MLSNLVKVTQLISMELSWNPGLLSFFSTERRVRAGAMKDRSPKLNSKARNQLFGRSDSKYHHLTNYRDHY